MKFISYEDSIKIGKQGDNKLEAILPEDILSSRSTNRPIINLYENSIEHYQLIQSIIKSCYGNRDGVVPGVYENFDINKIKISNFPDRPYTYYIRLPLGMVFLKKRFIENGFNTNRPNPTLNNPQTITSGTPQNTGDPSVLIPEISTRAGITTTTSYPNKYYPNNYNHVYKTYINDKSSPLNNTNPFKTEGESGYTENFLEDYTNEEYVYSYQFVNQPNFESYERELASLINLDLNDIDNDIKVYPVPHNGTISYTMMVQRGETEKSSFHYFPTQSINPYFEIRLRPTTNDTSETINATYKLIDSTGFLRQQIIITFSKGLDLPTICNYFIKEFNLKSEILKATITDISTGKIQLSYQLNQEFPNAEPDVLSITEPPNNKTILPLQYWKLILPQTFNQANDVSINLVFKNLGINYNISIVLPKGLNLLDSCNKFVEIFNTKTSILEAKINSTSTGEIHLVYKNFTGTWNTSNSSITGFTDTLTGNYVTGISVVNNKFWNYSDQQIQEPYHDIFEMTKDFCEYFEQDLIPTLLVGEVVSLESIIRIDLSKFTSSANGNHHLWIYYNQDLKMRDPLKEQKFRMLDKSLRFGITDDPIDILDTFERTGFSTDTTTPRRIDGIPLFKVTININANNNNEVTLVPISTANKDTNFFILYDKRTIYTKRAELNSLLSTHRTDLRNYLWFKDDENSPKREIRILGDNSTSAAGTGTEQEIQIIAPKIDIRRSINDPAVSALIQLNELGINFQSDDIISLLQMKANRILLLQDKRVSGARVFSNYLEFLTDPSGTGTGTINQINLINNNETSSSINIKAGITAPNLGLVNIFGTLNLKGKDDTLLTFVETKHNSSTNILFNNWTTTNTEQTLFSLNIDQNSDITLKNTLQNSSYNVSNTSEILKISSGNNNPPNSNYIDVGIDLNNTGTILPPANNTEIVSKKQEKLITIYGGITPNKNTQYNLGQGGTNRFYKTYTKYLENSLQQTVGKFHYKSAITNPKTEIRAWFSDYTTSGTNSDNIINPYEKDRRYDSNLGTADNNGGINTGETNEIRLISPRIRIETKLYGTESTARWIEINNENQTTDSVWTDNDGIDINDVFENKNQIKLHGNGLDIFSKRANTSIINVISGNTAVNTGILNFHGNFNLADQRADIINIIERSTTNDTNVKIFNWQNGGTSDTQKQLKYWFNFKNNGDFNFLSSDVGSNGNIYVNNPEMVFNILGLTGNKRMTYYGDIQPAITEEWDLGKETLKWKNISTCNLFFEKLEVSDDYTGFKLHEYNDGSADYILNAKDGALWNLGAIYFDKNDTDLINKHYNTINKKITDTTYESLLFEDNKIYFSPNRNTNTSIEKTIDLGQLINGGLPDTTLNKVKLVFDNTGTIQSAGLLKMFNYGIGTNYSTDHVDSLTNLISVIRSDLTIGNNVSTRKRSLYVTNSQKIDNQLILSNPSDLNGVWATDTSSNLIKDGNNENLVQAVLYCNGGAVFQKKVAIQGNIYSGGNAWLGINTPTLLTPQRTSTTKETTNYFLNGSVLINRGNVIINNNSDINYSNSLDGAVYITGSTNLNRILSRSTTDAETNDGGGIFMGGVSAQNLYLRKGTENSDNDSGDLRVNGGGVVKKKFRVLGSTLLRDTLNVEKNATFESNSVVKIENSTGTVLNATQTGATQTGALQVSNGGIWVKNGIYSENKISAPTYRILNDTVKESFIYADSGTGEFINKNLFDNSLQATISFDNSGGTPNLTLDAGYIYHITLTINNLYNKTINYSATGTQNISVNSTLTNSSFSINTTNQTLELQSNSITFTQSSGYYIKNHYGTITNTIYNDINPVGYITNKKVIGTLTGSLNSNQATATITANQIQTAGSYNFGNDSGDSFTFTYTYICNVNNTVLNFGARSYSGSAKKYKINGWK